MMIAFDSSQLDWQKVDGLIPVIIQHQVSAQVLMLGYMNQQALEQSQATGKVTFFSRTKQRLWTKGESSNNWLNIQSIQQDCDQDSLLILALPAGPTCHLGTESCFVQQQPQQHFLYQLEQLIASRKTADPASSYTAQLFHSGSKRMAQKVGEEGVEVALAAATNDDEELINESADLVYHLLVLLQSKNLNLSTIIERLKQRHVVG